METRFYQTQDLDLQRIAQALVLEYQSQGYEAQQFGDFNQMHVQLKKESALRTITGFNKALGISLQRVNGGTLVRVGAQDWMDQIVVGAVGLAVHPLLSRPRLFPRPGSPPAGLIWTDWTVLCPWQQRTVMKRTLMMLALASAAFGVVYATTKYLGGHGDVTGGAVVAGRRDAFFERIRAIQTSAGAIPSPFDCWLVRRGLRTLPWRMRAHSDNALRVATFLAAHPRVEAVHYPGLASHPEHAVAKRQMSGFGGMLSVQVKGGRDAAFAVEGKVRLFTCATSFGGTESLLEHRASVEGAATRSPENLLRLSIGLEDPADLIADLVQALG